MAVNTVPLDPITKGTAPWTNTFKLAVAANFRDAAIQMAINFRDSTSCPDKSAIYIYPNSTGVLQSEILANKGFYDAFFSAEEITNGFIGDVGSPVTTADRFLYAIGVPVIFALQNVIPTTPGLVSGTLGGTEATIPGNPLTTYSIVTSNANKVCIADPASAPYGRMAEKIIAELAKPTPPTPAVDTVTQNTVTDVLINVMSGANGVKSGFVARSQVFFPSSVRNQVTFVAFTNLEFQLKQDALKLTANANSLISFINAQMTPSGTNAWNTFLQSFGYLAIS